MSGGQPAAPQRREMEIMRVLFERHLKDRAVALADSRWPGSGRMVDLAYDWSQLTPAQRREQLSAIGPEEIARLREFSTLNPELAAAVDELDRRGVLPHLEAAAADATAAAQAAYLPEQQEPAAGPTTNESADVEPSHDHRLREHEHAPEPPPQAMNDAAQPEQPATAAEDDDWPPREFDFEDAGIDALVVDMPELDLGLPTTAEFLSDQEERRQQAITSAEATMERVRRSLDQTSQRALERGAAMSSGPKLAEIGRMPVPRALPETKPTAQAPPGIHAIEPPASLADALREQVVKLLDPAEPQPSDDELVALANELQVGYAEFTLAPGKRRELYGGLTSRAGRIDVDAGPLPRAIAEANLIVIHGRLTPQATSRIKQGFFDIPGTRASVRVHPDARVLVLPA